jgi:hypothetical protein
VWLVQQIAVWDHEAGTLLQELHISAFGSKINGIADIAPWVGLRAAPTTTSNLHFVVSLESLPSGASARSTRGSQALNSQVSALGSHVSQRPWPITSGNREIEDCDDVTAVPACLLVGIDVCTGALMPCRKLLLFDSSVRGEEGSHISAGQQDHGSESRWNVLEAPSSSVACDPRHVVAGFQSGTVAMWSAASARLVALLREPRNWNGVGRESKGRTVGSRVTCMAMHSGKQIIAVGRSNGFVDIWGPDVDASG